jgi:hypothetical protein
MMHGHYMTSGAIAGIAVGAAAVILLCAALCYFVGRANTYRDVLNRTKRTTAEDWAQRQFSPMPPQMEARAALPPAALVDHNQLAGTPGPPGYHQRQEVVLVSQETHELPGKAQPPVAEVGPYR